ncbi:hypothetical protein NT03LS_2037a, partial [Listeria seeligeri FSL N1-067]
LSGLVRELVVKILRLFPRELLLESKKFVNGALLVKPLLHF